MHIPIPNAAAIGQVVEGAATAREALRLAQRHRVEMPITEQIYQVLYCGKDAREAAVALLARASDASRSTARTPPQRSSALSWPILEDAPPVRISPAVFMGRFQP